MAGVGLPRVRPAQGLGLRPLTRGTIITMFRSEGSQLVTGWCTQESYVVRSRRQSASLAMSQDKPGTSASIKHRMKVSEVEDVLEFLARYLYGGCIQ